MCSCEAECTFFSLGTDPMLMTLGYRQCLNLNLYTCAFVNVPVSICVNADVCMYARTHACTHVCLSVCVCVCVCGRRSESNQRNARVFLWSLWSPYGRPMVGPTVGPYGRLQIHMRNWDLCYLKRISKILKPFSNNISPNSAYEFVGDHRDRP